MNITSFFEAVNSPFSHPWRPFLPSRRVEGREARYCCSRRSVRQWLRISVRSATVSARSMAIRVCRKSGIPLKMGEAARWRRVCRMPRYSSMRSTLMRSISSSTSILSSMVSPLPVFVSPLSPRLISSKIHGQPKVARPTITPSTPYCSNRLRAISGVVTSPLPMMGMWMRGFAFTSPISVQSASPVYI